MPENILKTNFIEGQPINVQIEEKPITFITSFQEQGLSGTSGYSGTSVLLLIRLTTIERNALTAINGMVIYNLTDNKFQGYENGNWINLCE